MFCTESLVCLISSRLGRLFLRLAGNWGIVLNEGLNGQGQCSLTVGSEIKEEIRRGKRRLEKKEMCLYLYCFKIQSLLQRSMPPSPRRGFQEETKEKERISATSRQNR